MTSAPPQQVRQMNLNNLLSSLKVSFQEGLNWLWYFLRDNPLYGVVVVVLVVVLWLLYKAEVTHK